MGVGNVFGYVLLKPLFPLWCVAGLYKEVIDRTISTALVALEVWTHNHVESLLGLSQDTILSSFPVTSGLRRPTFLPKILYTISPQINF